MGAITHNFSFLSRLLSSGIWHYGVWYTFPDVSGECAYTIFYYGRLYFSSTTLYDVISLKAMIINVRTSHLTFTFLVHIITTHSFNTLFNIIPWSMLRNLKWPILMSFFEYMYWLINCKIYNIHTHISGSQVCGWRYGQAWMVPLRCTGKLQLGNTSQHKTP